jgi:hypothetical protein
MELIPELLVLFEESGDLGVVFWALLWVWARARVHQWESAQSAVDDPLPDVDVALHSASWAIGLSLLNFAIQPSVILIFPSIIP